MDRCYSVCLECCPHDTQRVSFFIDVQHAHDLLNAHQLTHTLHDDYMVLPNQKKMHEIIVLLTDHLIIPTSWYPQSNGLEEYFLNMLDEEVHTDS